MWVRHASDVRSAWGRGPAACSPRTGPDGTKKGAAAALAPHFLARGAATLAPPRPAPDPASRHHSARTTARQRTAGSPGMGRRSVPSRCGRRPGAGRRLRLHRRRRPQWRLCCPWKCRAVRRRRPARPLGRSALVARGRAHARTRGRRGVVRGQPRCPRQQKKKRSMTGDKVWPRNCDLLPLALSPSRPVLARSPITTRGQPRPRVRARAYIQIQAHPSALRSHLTLPAPAPAARPPEPSTRRPPLASRRRPPPPPPRTPPPTAQRGAARHHASS